MRASAALAVVVCGSLAAAFTPALPTAVHRRHSRRPPLRASEADVEVDIESPFAPGGAAVAGGDETLPLTLENVELVLDEMRPYLMSDGGNVAVSEIDGPVVRLLLEGNCGSCPSSSMTMKMGLEKRLREKIPEISDVVQAVPNVPDLTEEAIDEVLEGIRPFLQVAGGTIEIVSLTGAGGISPLILLKMDGSSKTLRSVKLEIMQRVQRNFMQPSLRIEWED